MTISHLSIQSDVSKALMEDIGQGDVTAALLPDNLEVEAEIISREPMLLCGTPWVNEVFRQIDPAVQIDWKQAEGDWLKKPTLLCHIQGSVRSILTAERSALNFLQTLSGTATQTWFCVQALGSGKTRLLDTRKTLPGLRRAQKYAVTCGGGINHRMGLYDAFLIKENHIKAAGSLTKAVELAKKHPDKLLVEVEVETFEELQEALEAKPDRIMLDNFTLDMIQAAVNMNQTYQIALEVSGGITREDLRKVASTGVDFISMGNITKSVKAIDLSLLIKDSI